MLDGLQRKLLGNGFLPLTRHPEGVIILVPTGKASLPNGSEPVGKRTPLPSTVMPAPSYAPMSVGSWSISARLPFRVASHPTVASRGVRSTANFCAAVQVYGPPLL